VEVKATVDEAIGVAKEVYGFWGKLARMFGGAPKPTQSQPVAKKKEKFVAVDETKVMADVVKHLTELFRLQAALAVHIRAEEEKARTVYDPDANLMEAALQRVMVMDQMAALEVEVRETMVYQSPPEMGALYSKVFEMRDVIQEEQEQARLKEEAKERFKQWQRAEERRDFRAKSAYLVITFLFLLYLWMWFLFVARLGKT
jgi:hypothetical protein